MHILLKKISTQTSPLTYIKPIYYLRLGLVSQMHTLAIFILSPLFTLLSISKISKPFSLLKICHQIVHKVLEAFN